MSAIGLAHGQLLRAVSELEDAATEAVGYTERQRQEFAAELVEICVRIEHARLVITEPERDAS